MARQAPSPGTSSSAPATSWPLPAKAATGTALAHNDRREPRPTSTWRRRWDATDEPARPPGPRALHTLSELARYNTERHKAVQAAGGDIPGLANFAKLSMTDVVRLSRDLGLAAPRRRGMLHAYDDEGRKALAAEPGGVAAIMVTSQALGAQAPPIYGGTDQIQRNIIGERVLGLPKEPGDLSSKPFSELPKNG